MAKCVRIIVYASQSQAVLDEALSRALPDGTKPYWQGEVAITVTTVTRSGWLRRLWRALNA